MKTTLKCKKNKKLGKKNFLTVVELYSKIIFTIIARKPYGNQCKVR